MISANMGQYGWGSTDYTDQLLEKHGQHLDIHMIQIGIIVI